MQNRGEESRASIRKGGTPFDYLSLVPAAPWLEALALVRVHWGWRRNELSQNRTLTSSTSIVYYRYIKGGLDETKNYSYLPS